MTLLGCADCNHAFTESEAPVVPWHEPYEFHGERGVHTSNMLACPMCGGLDIDELPNLVGDDEVDLLRQAGAI